MGIDHNIYFNQKGAADIFGGFQKGHTIGQLVKRGRQQRAKEEETEAIKGIFKKNLIPSESGALTLNREATLGEIAGYSPELMLKFDRQWSLDDERARKVKNSELGDKKKSIDNLRKEIQGTNQYKDLQKVDTSYRKINTSLERKSAAGDMSAIFSFMKINDPGSTVREGEFATAQNAAGWDDKFRNYYNNALKGVRLSGDQRVDFQETARGLAGSQYESFMNSMKPQMEVIKKRGLNGKQIFGDYSHLKSKTKQLAREPNKGSGASGSFAGINDAHASSLRSAQERIKGMTREEKIKLLRGN